MTLTLPATTGRRCAFTPVTIEHTAQAAQWLAEGVSVARVQAALTTAGYRLSLSAVNTHRLGLCQSCDVAELIRKARA